MHATLVPLAFESFESANDLPELSSLHVQRAKTAVIVFQGINGIGEDYVLIFEARCDDAPNLIYATAQVLDPGSSRTMAY